METIYEENNIRFHIVPHKAFKTVSIVIKIKGALTRETISKRALLPYVLAQGPQNYPSRRVLQLKLDELYGARLSIDGAKKGDNHVITVRLETANQKYIQQESSALDEALQMVHDVVFNPNTSKDGFQPEIVTREKTTLKKKIDALPDDKMAYANMRLLDEMCKDEPYQLHVHGYKDDLPHIQEDNLYDYYQHILNEDVMDVYVLGDVAPSELKEKLNETFIRKRSPGHRKTDSAHLASERQEAQTVTEKQMLQQAKLHMGYRTHCTYGDDHYGALHVFNGLFGGFPSSKLFINVREKNSLAYYAASRIESHKGLMLVFSGIAPNDYKQAKTIIAEQLEAMKSGEFTQETLEETKELIVNQLLETMDIPYGLIEMLYQQILAEVDYTPHTLIDKVKAVTKEEVVKVAQSIHLDTVYLLTDKGGGDGE